MTFAMVLILATVCSATPSVDLNPAEDLYEEDINIAGERNR